MDSVGLPEGLLQRMQVIHGPQSLDGENLVAIGLHGEHQAGADRLSVEQDGARAAHAVLAADVRAGQTQLVAQEVAQQQARLDGPFILGAVDGDGHIEFEKVAHIGLLITNIQ